MDLMTAVMFLVGLAAGGGGAFFFVKKKTVVSPIPTPQPVASHQTNSKDTEEIKKLNAQIKKITDEKEDLKNEVQVLKNSEEQLKVQLTEIAEKSKQSNNQPDNSAQIAKLKEEIANKERTINDISKSENDFRILVAQLQSELEIFNNKSKNDLAEKDDYIARLTQELQNASAPQAASGNTISVKPISERRIMVVDDSKVVRNKLNSTLKKAGYTITLAEDGRDALNKLQEDNKFDLVVTDLEMPNLDGHQLITEIHKNEKLKSIPVMAITGHEDITINVIHNEGLVGVHKKPWSDEELLRKIAGLSTLKVG